MPFADYMMKSNAVYTGKEEKPKKACVAIKANKILAVCDDGSFGQYKGAETKIYDYGDQMIMPGFIDAHTHFFMGAGFQSPCFVDLAETKSDQDCVDLIRQHLQQNPGIDHVLGWGWFLINWGTEVTPTRKILDENFPDIPLYLFAVDGHTCWLNSKALEVCGINEEIQVKFGDIEKDANGQLTGLLYEIAEKVWLLRKLGQRRKKTACPCFRMWRKAASHP